MIVTQGVNQPGGGRVISTTGATYFRNGKCVGTAAPAVEANDTILVGLLVHGAVTTITIAGFLNDQGAAANIVLTTTADTYFPLGCINEAGTLTITPSTGGSVVAITAPANAG